MALLGILGILATPVTEVVKCLTIPFARQIQYIIQYKKNTDKLRVQLDELVLKRDDVNHSIEAGRRKGESTKHEVQAWIERVNSFHAKAMGFLNDASIHERANSCIVGCPSRYRIGKKAKKMINKVNALITKGEFDVVSEFVPPPSIALMPCGDFEVFDATKVAMEQVMEALKDPKVNLIALYGIPGVGKTTLMTEVGKQAIKERLFDEVVMATVSQKIDLKTIQSEIAESLGLTLEEESKFPRGKRLFGLLKEDPRQILIILDDLWQRIKLSEVGIPLAGDHSGCKVVITTRSLDVCSVMKAQVKVKLEILSEKDSWFLFKKMVGNIVDIPSLVTVSLDIANECEGLPIAIVTLGRALHEKNEDVWNDTASRLRKSIWTEIEGTSASVVKCIKLSYDFLESEETKLCFLLCCLFPEDYQISIEVLMRFMVGEGLFVHIETLEEARRSVRIICGKLKASGLLLEGENDEYVMMHDVIRDVAISIAKENSFLPLSYSGLKQWPEREKLDKYIRISLINTKINDLPSQPICPNLLMLLLQNNNSLGDISNSFFEHMKNLSVLDLSNNSMSVLPQSFSCITQLRTLFLESCSWLKDVSLIGELKNLEVLSLRNSSIQMLPEEIGGLTRLRLLNLSHTENLKSIPPKVISNLSRLEELDMSYSFSGWEAEVGDGINASLCEVTSLTSLTTLYIHVKNARCMSINIPNNYWENLQRFGISFNDQYWGSNVVRSMCLNTISVSNWVKVLVDKTEELNLVSCNDLKNVAQLNARGFKNLKYMYIQDCHGVDYIVGGEEDIQRSAFVSLHELHLNTLERLENICYGPLPKGLLANLKILKVQNCHKLISLLSYSLLLNLQNLEVLEANSCYELKDVFEFGGLKDEQGALPKLKVLILIKLDRLRSVFSPSMIHRLQQLEEIKIKGCHRMVTLISEDDDEQPTTSVPRNESRDLDNMPFTSLRTLELEHLPNLSSLYQGQRGLVWPSLEELVVWDCENLKTLPFIPQNTPKLRVIYGKEEWFSGLEWRDKSVKLQFQHLFQKLERSIPPRRGAIKRKIVSEIVKTLGSTIGITH